MKALIYKELKLAMHPICYIFICVFPLMILIPSYPLAVGFIYILSAYPILFLGANKGQQTNDLLFTTLLPVRKKDIVLARIITCLFMQLVAIFIMLLLTPIATITNQAIIAASEAEGQTAPQIPGLGLNSILTVVSIALICLAIADFVFFNLYYKNGKSIVLSSLVTIFGFTVLISILTIAIPMVVPGFFNAIDESLGLKFLTIMIGVFVSAGIHYATYVTASNKLEKVDF